VYELSALGHGPEELGQLVEELAQVRHGVLSINACLKGNDLEQTWSVELVMDRVLSGLEGDASRRFVRERLFEAKGKHHRVLGLTSWLSNVLVRYTLQMIEGDLPILGEQVLVTLGLRRWKCIRHGKDVGPPKLAGTGLDRVQEGFEVYLGQVIVRLERLRGIAKELAVSGLVIVKDVVGVSRNKGKGDLRLGLSLSLSHCCSLSEYKETQREKETRIKLEDPILRSKKIQLMDENPE